MKEGGFKDRKPRKGLVGGVGVAERNKEKPILPEKGGQRRQNSAGGFIPQGCAHLKKEKARSQCICGWGGQCPIGCW